MINYYLKQLINKIYKILPLKEYENVGLVEYLDSLSIELTGALNTYQFLESNQYYISIINTINFFKNNKFDIKQCKREVFKCISYVKEIQKEIGEL